RLFWKIFFAFWLALLAAAIGTGIAVSLHRPARPAADPDLAVGLPAALAADLASSTLRYGGVDALRSWMTDVQRTRGLALLAADRQPALGVPRGGRGAPRHASAAAHERTPRRDRRPRRGLRPDGAAAAEAGRRAAAAAARRVARAALAARAAAGGDRPGAPGP